TVEKVAPTGSRVLISGPPGAGKEVVARMIHAKSRRAEGPFVVMNCAILAPEKFEAELFGVEAGPETPRKQGVLERAHGGTLLLDEVSELPLEMQSKIARVLQDQSFERVGGATRVKVDIRVLATTVKDLQAEIGEGRFREDLYYRLAVVPLRVPALKERREDIPALANQFLSHAAEISGLPARSLASDAVAALQAHDWPGNVRQLRNVMDWLMIMRSGEPGEQFHAEHLPTELAAHAPRALAIDPAADVMALPLREARDVFETQYLQAQLLRFGGNISRTANFVGMERSALHRKLKQLGIGAAEDKVA
ncbi:MAG: sigma-54-dependent Fis family transcriptional regulator, partial [Rhodospirillales bacterium]|nr:sigma-54-dependent Fis family transcriptional regulator [Rhodospirillales bacterium]